MPQSSDMNFKLGHYQNASKQLWSKLPQMLNSRWPPALRA
jgi:hypothetical protein